MAIKLPPAAAANSDPWLSGLCNALNALQQYLPTKRAHRWEFYHDRVGYGVTRTNINARRVDALIKLPFY